MIAIVDACTIFNLVNLTEDATYIGYLQKSFSSVYIAPQVYHEIGRKKKDGLHFRDDDTEKAIIKDLEKLIRYEQIENPKEFTANVFRIRKGGKEDGEFLSICHSLDLSRIIMDDRSGKNLLKVCFFTDDDVAKLEFSKYYEINQIGQILDSVDLLIVFRLKGYINSKILERECKSLKKFYSKPLLALENKVKELKKQPLHNELQNRLSAILEMIHNYSDDSHKNLVEAIGNLPQAFIRTHKDLLLLVKELNHWRPGKKISALEEKISRLSNIYI